MTNEILLQQFETPEANFFKGIWIADITVLVRKDKRSGCFHINASHFCHPNKKAKQFSNWSRNQSTQDMITYMNTISADPSIVTALEVPNEWKGTYIHLDLFPHLASWISPQIAIKVSAIVNMLYKEKFSSILEEKNLELEEKDAVIREIRELLRQQQTANEQQRLRIEQQHDATIQRLDERTGLIIDQNIGLRGDLSFVKRAVSAAIDTRVIMTADRKKDEVLAVFKLNDPNFGYKYSVFRGQKCNEAEAAKNLKVKHPQCQVLQRYEYQQVFS
jgi:hypothetical protein